MAYKQELGAAGEQAVADRYIANGFVVLSRNWRDGRSGELDLVLGLVGVAGGAGFAGGAPLVVVCEVKTRTSDRFGNGLEAVTPSKQRRLRLLASAWMIAHRDKFDEWSLIGRCELRIDVAAVSIDRAARTTTIEIIEGAC